MQYKALLFVAGVALGAAGVQAQMQTTGHPATAPNSTTSGQMRQNGAGNGMNHGTMANRPNGQMNGNNAYGTNGRMNGANGRMTNDRMNGTNGRMNSSSTRNTYPTQSRNSAHIRRCEARYHTYDSRTDMFYARPGVKQRCRL